MEETTDLIFTSRLYKYIKSSAVTNMTQAYVELITNCYDAYNKGDFDKKIINITANLDTRMFCVYDQAVGLTYDEMMKCFAQVGSYTSTTTSRGYFSRGAKDISAIGDVRFRSIKNNKISEIILTTNDTVITKRKDEDVNDDDRDDLDIYGNGLWVCITLKSGISLPTVEELENTKNYYSLRDIFADTDVSIHLKVIKESNIVYNSNITYTNPAVKKLLIHEEYEVEGYEGVKSTFKLEYLEEPGNINDHGSFMSHGILVSSNNAIHEISTLYNDIRSHPYIGHLRGRIDCPYINELMYKFDEDPNQPNNPFPIIDHSRLNGLDRSHPFTKALFRIPHKQILLVLQDLYSDGVLNEDFSDNLMSLFKNVELFGENFFKEMVQAVYNYKIIDTEKTNAYLLKKVSSGIITSIDKNSKYHFDETFIKESSKSNIKSLAPKLNILFTERDFLKNSYYIYRINNDIYLEINLNDYLVSRYIQRDNFNKIQFTEVNGASMLLISVISEALSRESIREKEENLDKTYGIDELFNEFEKIRSTLIPKLYDLIVADNMKNLTFK